MGGFSFCLSFRGRILFHFVVVLLLCRCNHYSLQTRLTPLGLSRLSRPLAHMHCIGYGESELGWSQPWYWQSHFYALYWVCETELEICESELGWSQPWDWQSHFLALYWVCETEVGICETGGLISTLWPTVFSIHCIGYVNQSWADLSLETRKILSVDCFGYVKQSWADLSLETGTFLSFHCIGYVKQLGWYQPWDLQDIFYHCIGMWNTGGLISTLRSTKSYLCIILGMWNRVELISTLRSAKSYLCIVLGMWNRAGLISTLYQPWDQQNLIFSLYWVCENELSWTQPWDRQSVI